MGPRAIEGHGRGQRCPLLPPERLSWRANGQTSPMTIPASFTPTAGRIAVPAAVLAGTAVRFGSSPLVAPRMQLPSIAFGGGSAGDSRPANKNEVHGTPDGPPVRLASGLVVQPMVVNGQRVTKGELMDAIRGVSLLPATDVAAVAQAGVHLQLLPVANLEDSLLGATSIVRKSEGHPWQPTLVRVAVRARLRGEESTPEIVQHELGHVVSVLRSQDTTENAAETYAKRH